MSAFPRHGLHLAGTFNDWTTDHPAFALSRQQAGHWEARVYLQPGRHAFKVAADGGWALNWGADAAGPVQAPRQGPLAQEGPDILLNVPRPGQYAFHIDLEESLYSIDAPAREPGPAGALQPYRTVRDLSLSEADFHGRLPMLLEHDEVVFVIEEDGDAVAVAGTWNGWSTEADVVPPGPGPRFLHVRMDRSQPQSYKFYRQGTWLRDPLNRLVDWDGINRGGVGEFNSVLPARDGRVQPTAMLWLKRFPSVFLEDERDIFVMLPPGYDPSVRYPVLYVHDGNESITRGAYHLEALGAMQEATCQPVILVFVALPVQHVRNYQYVHGEGYPRYARFLAHEVAPFIDAHFSTRAQADARGVIGASLGGACSFYVALQHPDVFGKAASQSGSFFVNNMDLLARVRDGRSIDFYLDSSRPYRGSKGDMYRLASMMEHALQDAGCRHWHYHTRGDWHDWRFWAQRFPAALRYFWPRRKR